MIPFLLRISETSHNKLKQLVVKLISAKGIYQAEEYSPFGTDSRPPKGMTAIYIKTQRDGDEAIIGYLHKDRLSQVGEHRIFSTDENLEMQTYVWLKNDGTMEIGGNTKHMVRYEELKTEFDKLKQDFNSLVTKYNSHVHPIINGFPLASPPGVVTSGPTPTTATPTTADISGSKIDEIKTL